MIKIQLTKGQETVVSDEDADLVQFKWTAAIAFNYVGGGKFRVKRNRTVGNGKQATELMHRVILSRMLGRPLNRDEFVDHRDSNPLNNTRENLRLATNSQNQMNRCKVSNTTSHLKGVSWHKGNKSWDAQIKVDGKSIHIGSFSTQEDAHEAYKKAAIKYFGEFARFD